MTNNNIILIYVKNSLKLISYIISFNNGCDDFLILKSHVYLLNNLFSTLSLCTIKKIIN